MAASGLGPFAAHVGATNELYPAIELPPHHEDLALGALRRLVKGSVVGAPIDEQPRAFT